MEISSCCIIITNLEINWGFTRTEWFGNEFNDVSISRLENSLNRFHRICYLTTSIWTLTIMQGIQPNIWTHPCIFFINLVSFFSNDLYSFSFDYVKLGCGCQKGYSMFIRKIFIDVQTKFTNLYRNMWNVNCKVISMTAHNMYELFAELSF